MVDKYEQSWSKIQASYKKAILTQANASYLFAKPAEEKWIDGYGSYDSCSMCKAHGYDRFRPGVKAIEDFCIGCPFNNPDEDRCADDTYENLLEYTEARELDEGRKYHRPLFLKLLRERLEFLERTYNSNRKLIND